ncbi:glutathione S-transferase, putative [marine gamma proteobacterium HTCC2143]|jgi:glutathione S-transferase|uniref:Glutathione S-transferase, putative n=1 Tax=marine gamma proteobacterium HTCC2143 TaxID=247633 RepID=A0YAG7_9GAMM|nr:glutathione S-transferase, putative [marine gamma proteobacterium HTCC2143]|tara:strand:- start:187 stop:822 length:636 start_codon:yes stop_codon:yes gene_type:complete
MAITFYDFSRAPSPRRARILLAEKGVDVETVSIDMTKAEQLGDAFRAINPGCTIPALKLDDGTVLTENNGIAAYLEAQFPNPPMLGVTPVEKGLVANWTAKIELEGLMAAAEALRNSSPGMKDRAITGPVNHQQIPELAERGLARLNTFFDMLDARLEDREFIAIDSFSNADITAAVVVDFAAWVKVIPQEHQKNLIRWRESLNSRPSMSL